MAGNPLVASGFGVQVPGRHDLIRERMPRVTQRARETIVTINLGGFVALAPHRWLQLPLPRKEVIQPHLPVRLPCYDFTPITSPTFDGSLPEGWVTGFGCCRLP